MPSLDSKAGFVDLLAFLSARGVTSGARVLDLGCGTGRHARGLARAGYRVFGVDSDVDAVETARALADESADAGGSARGPDSFRSPPRFLAARAESLPFPAAVFHALVCVDVLHWVADEAAFRAIWHEAWRVLRPGGVFIGRCLMREELPEATPVVTGPGDAGDGRGGAGLHRLPQGTVWFLPSRALLDDVLAHGAGVVFDPPRASAGTPGAAWFIARKPG